MTDKGEEEKEEDYSVEKTPERRDLEDLEERVSDGQGRGREGRGRGRNSNEIQWSLL